MAKNVLCSYCQKIHTTHPSGICAACRRLKFSTYCRICGVIRTTNSDGICARCKEQGESSAKDSGRIKKAIERETEMLRILELRSEGKSYGEISQIIGLSKSSIYTRLSNTMFKFFHKGANSTWLEKNTKFP